jgi:hypothetical protein
MVPCLLYKGANSALTDWFVSSFPLYPNPFVKGISHPEFCAQRTGEAEDFFSTQGGLRGGPYGYFLIFFLLAAYPIGMKPVKRDKFIHSLIPGRVFC